MFGVDVKIEDNTKAVEKAAERAGYRNFSHAAASIRKQSRASIKPAPKKKVKIVDPDGDGGEKPKKRYLDTPSPEGTPPYTRGRQKLKKGILYNADQFGAVIGPSYRIAGEAGFPHEFGARFRKQKFKPRPFMGPALMANLSRFAGSWRNSVQP